MDAKMGMAMAMPQMQGWSLAEALLLFAMWAVMMVAMMVPAAAPMILMFVTINRHRQAQQSPTVPTAIFVAGYVLVWTGFSAVAAAAQWGLHAVALLSPTMVSTSPYLGGALLIAAGLFQWTPLKRACLTGCRSPLSFLMSEWRDGRGGALAMGFRHGAYCLGCCWLLMALLFVGGVMNLLWVAAIAGFVLAEKVAAWGERLGHAAGVILVLGGIALSVSTSS
jgi:predicted metal-binding membrane protein